MHLLTRPFFRLLVLLIITVLCSLSSEHKSLAAKLPFVSPISHDRISSYESFEPNEVIVKMKPDRNAQSLRYLKSARFVSSRPIPFGYSLLNIEGDVPATCKELSINPDVLIAEPNYIRYVSQIPNDPRWPQQKNLNLSNAPLGWDIETGDAKVVVAVIDTGVDYNHPDLQPNLLPGRNFRDSGDEMDDSGHGTAVCGVIGAVGNNSIGIAGSAWRVKILPLRACGGSELKCDVVHTVEAIEEAIAQDVDIINLSLGGFDASSLEREAIDEAWNAGIVIFAAAGNESKLGKFGNPELEQYITYPAGYENVCGVSSVDYPSAGEISKTRLSNFSNYGDAVSVTAVGSGVLTTAPTVDVANPIFGTRKDYGTISGTSFSTPLVSGIAALVKSHFPDMTAHELRARIEQSVWDIGTPGWDDQFGWGLVDFQKALMSGTYASNEAFNLGITTSPILTDDIILVVKAKVSMTNNPVVYYIIMGLEGVEESGNVDLRQIPGDGTLFSGRLHTVKNGDFRFTVCGSSQSGPLPDLVLEYFKKTP